MNIKLSTAVLAASLSGAGVVWADVVPSIGVEARHSDNIYSAANNEVDSWVVVARPNLDVEIESGANSYTLDLGAESGEYLNDKNGNDDYLDSHINLGANLEFTPSNHLELDAGFAHLHEDRGTDRTAGVALANRHPDELDQKMAAAKYTLGSREAKGRLEVGLDHMGKDYTNNRTVRGGACVFGNEGTCVLDRDSNQLTVAAYMKVMPKTSIFVEARDKAIDYDRKSNVLAPAAVANVSRDSDENRYFVGAEWEATAKTTGTVRLGRQKKDFDDNRMDDFSASAWEVEVVYQPRSYSTIQFLAEHGTDESSSLSYIDQHSYTLSWNNDWSDRVSSNVYYTFLEQDHDKNVVLGFNGRDEEMDIFGVSLDYKMTEDMKFYASYTYEDKDASVPVPVAGVNFDFDRNTIAFGVDYAFK